MNNNKPFDWNAFQHFFTNYNPYEVGEEYYNHQSESYIYELIKGKLLINSQESDDEFIIDIPLPNNINFDEIHHKVITNNKPSGRKYKSLNIRIPKNRSIK